jgi:alpha-tubulin suppressor-like RCC1 family protein
MRREPKLAGLLQVRKKVGYGVNFSAHVDPSGSIPNWMVNKWGDGFVDELKRYFKALGLDKVK